MKFVAFREIGLLVAAATRAPISNKANPIWATAAPTSLRFPPKACPRILALARIANTQLKVSRIYIKFV
ncbi:hypothetical protein D3C71_2093230 [compost metagenome]